MLMKANPANNALADDETPDLTEQAPFETIYPVLHEAHVVADVQTEHYDGHPPHVPMTVPYPPAQTAHEDVPF